MLCLCFLERMEIRRGAELGQCTVLKCVCVSLQQPSAQLRSFHWWRSRVWIVTLLLEEKWCSWLASTSSLTPRWCLWRRPRVSCRHQTMFTASQFPLLISLSNVSFPLCPCRVSPVSPPVKIVQALPESHMWCALSHYIFNQSIFTFAEVSIACSLVLATS